MAAPHEAPRYQAEGKLFVGINFYQPGEVFASDARPGSKWRPINKAAEAKCKQHGVSLPEIEIPDGWLDQRPETVINLARKLGASGKCNFAQAVSHIEKVLADREQGAA
jgi:hypothetical protein